MAEHQNGANLGTVGAGSASGLHGLTPVPEHFVEASLHGLHQASTTRHTGELQNTVEGFLEPVGSVPDMSPFGPERIQNGCEYAYGAACGSLRERLEFVTRSPCSGISRES